MRVMSDEVRVDATLGSCGQLGENLDIVYTQLNQLPRSFAFHSLYFTIYSRLPPPDSRECVPIFSWLVRQFCGLVE